MVEQVTGHPAADLATEEALIVEQSRGVVPASSWVIDAARSALRSKRILQVLTPEESRITYPMELLLADAAAEWIVQEDASRYRDGIRGVPMSWTGTRFARDPGRRAVPPQEPEIDTGDLEIRISVVHPAEAPLRLGTAVEAALRALTGEAPTGWGNAEPATRPWSAEEVTEYCRNRAPGHTQLVVVGPGMTGQLRVSSADRGLVEETLLSGPGAGTVRPEDVASLAGQVAGTARLMLVAVHPGRRGGSRSSTPSRPALPYGLLAGQEIVAARGVEHAERAPTARIELLGSAAWCTFDGGPRPPYEQLADLLRHFGLPRS
ncbi:DUF6177 family protein [Amycolatopsis keratiniphila]|uniref:Uncharacterized protein n=1 Tax=Amycolatopsis keratiniphila subsp. keratiniphila TaxID=227715 RepID=A0A1W2LZB4_9PSEU|nr:DUF6177 family protein [Amycolatopsis keratiniphila]ONF72573.1 hypothetical protein AVR91_0210295 [Amycolatopsis keratiniphila subsp. keratiniphila]